MVAAARYGEHMFSSRSSSATSRHRAAAGTAGLAVLAGEQAGGYELCGPDSGGGRPWDGVPHPVDTVDVCPDPGPPSGSDHFEQYTTGELVELAGRMLGCVRGRLGPTVEAVRAQVADGRQRWTHRAAPDSQADSQADGQQVGAGLLAELERVWDTGRTVALLGAARTRHTGADTRRMSQSLADRLIIGTPLPGVEVRRDLRAAKVLATMPRLASAATDGLIGGSALLVVCGQLERLKLSSRPMADALFGDRTRIARLSADELIALIDEVVAGLRPDLTDRAETCDRDQRRLSTRFEDGRLIGFFQLDGEAGATLLEALNAAAPPPSAGPNDTTRHAIGQRDPDEPDDPDELWALRARQRQHADALLRLAEYYLTHNPTPGSSSSDDVDGDGDRDGGGGGGGLSSGDGQDRGCVCGATSPGTSGRDGRGGGGSCGRPGRTGAPDPEAAAAAAAAARRRSRPRMLVWAELGLLAGDTRHARAARLLANHIGGPVRLTPEAALRLSSDATIRMILHDEGRILGSTDAQATITLAVRETVFARDQGCRFPGCTAPVQWCDLHHVIERHRGGPTTPENLVSLCRRHHTAVTNGRWQLTMTPDGIVTVRRGRQQATSVPPHLRRLHPKHHPD